MASVIRWNRFRIRPTYLLVDAILIIGSVYLSVYLRTPETFYNFLPIIHFYLPLIVLVRLGCLVAFRSYDISWRYISASDSFRLAQGLSLSTGLIVFISFFLTGQWGRLPRSFYFIDAMVCGGALFGARLLRRMRAEARNRLSTRSGLRTLIYGAGVNGKTMAQRFSSDASLNTHVVGFIDDSPEKQGLNINGVRVLGTGDNLEDLVRELDIQHLVLAVGNLPTESLRKVVTICTSHGIRPVITSHFGSQESTSWRDHQIVRSVSLHDLLNRPPREIDLLSVQQLIRGRRVLVTGAGGSIGAEITRQVASHSPAQLVILDHSEFSLFAIASELRVHSRPDKIIPILMDLKDQAQVGRLVSETKPELVIHAAAYKHVYLAQVNPSEVIRNNVLGTRNLLNACRNSNVDVFLLISTDKAVNPAGIMGATKRVCELMTTAVALQTGRRYCSVRFGNVMGSSGSLIPILEKQIREGGPVTVTHKDMTRYFMLIPEAVSLVLKACTIAQPGDINVLKMGEPVKIVEIAQNMIMLSGKSKDEIPIVFTGMRPGEKLFEELYLRGDELQTEHPDILTLPHGDKDQKVEPDKTLDTKIDQLLNAAENNSPNAADLLFTIVQTAPDQETVAALKDITPLGIQNNN